jgi:hypothetical protein
VADAGGLAVWTRRGQQTHIRPPHRNWDAEATSKYMKTHQVTPASERSKPRKSQIDPGRLGVLTKLRVFRTCFRKSTQALVLTRASHRRRSGNQPVCFSLLKKSLERNISNWKKFKPQPSRLSSASSCAGAAQRGRERGQKAHDFRPSGEFVHISISPPPPLYQRLKYLGLPG